MNQTTMASLPANVPPEAVVDFDVYAPPGLADDFHLAWKSLQREGLPDVVWTPRNGGHWLVTRGEDIAKILADFKHFSNRIMQVPRERSIGNRPIPGSLDPPEQLQFRALLNTPLSAKAVQSLEPLVRDLARSLVAKIAPNGRCEFVSEFALALPLSIFMHYADLPHGDLGRLRQLAEEKVRPTGKVAAAEIMQQLADYLGPHIRSRFEKPGSDLISQLLSGRVFGRPMSFDEAIRLCSQVLVAGLDTVASMLSFSILCLARMPDLRRRLTANPGLLPAAVEEFLRRFALVAIGRELIQDYNLGAVTLKAGDILIVPTMLHGLDERSFSKAMDIDIDRPRALNSTFGQGPHRCPGVFLARAEMRIALEEWLAKIPDFAVADATAIHYKSGVVGTIACLPLTIGKAAAAQQ
jgi:cytochrome P450